MSSQVGVACFKEASVQGEATFHRVRGGVRIVAQFSKLPPGEHGFHIHRAGDLRGDGCMGACEHYHTGPPASHGGPPSSHGQRHTGDLGNIVQGKRYAFFLPQTGLSDLFGRSLIVHADKDDLGEGSHEDSKTTGHSGARIGCAIIGRARTCERPPIKTRKVSKGSKGSKTKRSPSFSLSTE